MKKTMHLGIAVLAALAVFLLSGCAGQDLEPVERPGQGPAGAQQETFTIGWMGPLTGDAASYGIGVQKGVELAKSEFGMDNVEIVYEDSKCEGKAAVSSINKLISADRVQVIIGELCSGATLAAAPIAEQQNVVLISPASTSPEITTAGDYIFRTVPSDALQGSFGANLVYEKGFRKLAILYSNEDYGLGFNNVLMETFPALGGEVVASEAFERGATDVRTQMTKIKGAGPDVIYIISNSPDSAVVALKQFTELGLDIAVFASEGLKADYVIDNAGSSAEGMILTSVSTGSDDFIARHEAMFGEGPGPFATQGYDAFWAVATALKQGAGTGQEIKDAIYAMSFEGASGSVSFDENGDVSGNYEVYVVRDGEFVRED